MRKNNEEKHSKKKSPAAPISADLPLDLPVNPAGFTLRATCTAAEVFCLTGPTPLTGLTDPQLRQIALQKNPAGGTWFPSPVKNHYDTVALLRGLRARDIHQAARDKTPRLDTISFPSMEACEGALGIPKSVQQIAKTDGSSAFRGSRIYLVDIINWFFKTTATGTITNWGEMNVELDAKLKQVKLDTELRDLIPLAESDACLHAFAAILFNGLKRLEMEAPRDFEQRPRAYIKQQFAIKRAALLQQAAAELEKLKTTAPKTNHEPVAAK